MGLSVLDPLFYGDYDEFIKEMKRLSKILKEMENKKQKPK